MFVPLLAFHSWKQHFWGCLAFWLIVCYNFAYKKWRALTYIANLVEAGQHFHRDSACATNRPVFRHDCFHNLRAIIRVIARICKACTPLSKKLEARTYQFLLWTTRSWFLLRAHNKAVLARRWFFTCLHWSLSRGKWNRCTVRTANKLRVTFAQCCSLTAKNALFRAYCMPIFVCQLSRKYTQTSTKRLRVAYNNAFRIMHYIQEM